MAASSRLDRLVKVLGAENLPPKLSKPGDNTEQSDETAKQDGANTDDSFSELQSVDDFLKENKSTENWWDATPKIPQIATKAPTRPATSFFTSNGETHLEFDPRKGEPAPLGVSFSPFGAVTKFCYKFVKKDHQQLLATAFFAEGKIYDREWDIYCIWSDYYQTARRITFVPEHQLLALIDEINEAFPDARVTINDELREEGLVINFDDIERVDLRPRFLGHSTSRAQFEYWTTNLPFPVQIEGMMPDNDRTLEAFRAKMELATEIAKNKKKAAGKKRQAENVVKRQDMVRVLLRAERYLGMIEKTQQSSFPDVAKLSLAPIDVNEKPPHAFDADVVFIAIDVEAYERPPHSITEVGIATLDTRNLQDAAPKAIAEDWQQFIRARHFRIAEYKHLVNKDFVEGCPDRFEFGDSEFVGEDQISKAIADCFKPPYSGSGSGDVQDEKRNIILVGHDVSADVNYFRKLGYNASNCGNIIDTIDTANLFRAYTHDPNPRSLGNALYEFDLMGWHLHNAGNDAVYTLWAMLAICTKAASEQGSDQAAQEHAKNVEKRAEAAAVQAKERVKDEAEGWDSPGDDGGVAVRPADKTEYRSPRAKEHDAKRQLYTVGGSVLDV